MRTDVSDLRTNNLRMPDQRKVDLFENLSANATVYSNRRVKSVAVLKISLLARPTRRGSSNIGTIEKNASSTVQIMALRWDVACG